MMPFLINCIRSRIRFFLLCPIVIAGLQGCSTLKPPATIVPKQPSMDIPAPLAMRFHAVGQWEVDGPKRISGHFDWQHEPQHDTLTLLTAWSLPIAEITRENDQLIVHTSSGQHLTELQWLQASESLLGAPLIVPLEPLSAWIQGQFYPQMLPGKWLSKQDYASGEISGEQGGWMLTWYKQHPSVSKIPSRNFRPDRLKLQAPNVTYRLLLTLDQESSSWK